ncbi:catabolic 3-dehydroquinase 2 [Geopyxis carbonaria]|nr:catabolic 3-dehydroquinase 2 [Geopyxis carbonaria]
MPAPAILLINGPNVNLLGTREPHIYGATTLPDIVSTCTALATAASLTLHSFHSNHEGAIIDRLHDARAENVGWVVINPGGLTHTSVALRDALLAVGVQFVECHVTNVHAREEFRHKSFLSDKAVAVVAGLGAYGYEAAMGFVIRKIGEAEEKKKAEAAA